MVVKEQVELIFPTQARILVERIKETEVVTQGGIILTPGLKHADYSPNRSKELLVEKEQEEEDSFYEVKVLAVGPLTVGVKAGQKGIMNKYSGLDVFKDRTIFLINETDILALLGTYGK